MSPTLRIVIAALVFAIVADFGAKPAVGDVWRGDRVMRVNRKAKADRCPLRSQRVHVVVIPVSCGGVERWPLISDRH